MADESPKTMFLERTAYEAMQWAKEHNIGGDQPSLVFARRFAFLIQLPRSPIMLTAKPISHESKALELAAGDDNREALVEAISALRAEVAELKKGLERERQRACTLLEAAYEAADWLGPSDSVADEKLVPAILKADGDPAYAQQWAEDRGFFSASAAASTNNPRQGGGSVMSDLKPSTLTLLRHMHSRRDHQITQRKDARDLWIFQRRRVRTVVDYGLIADFPRAPPWARDVADRWIGSALAEARRAERMFGPRP